MYLAVDVGGTKTLLAVFRESGELIEKQKFPTPKQYEEFIRELEKTVDNLSTKNFKAGCLAIPGRVDREEGIGITFGNLPWENVHLAADIEKLVHAPFVLENDSKAAALSEAKLIKDDFKKVLYVTIGTGISAGLIINGIIDPEFADSESGHMLLEHEGKMQTWESFASGKAIVQKYGKRASAITDGTAWKAIAHNIAVGLINLIAVVQPEIIIIGGGVGVHFDKFGDFLVKELKKYENPMVPIPPIRAAQRPEEAVIYGGYELAKDRYGKTA